ncbi:MAG: magnesium chelatase subunit H [Pseudomonadota bacterium]
MRVEPHHHGPSGGPTPDRGTTPAPLRLVIVTLDHHFDAALDRVRAVLATEAPGLTIDLYATADWADSPEALGAAKAGVAEADIVLASMLFVDDHIRAILPDLEARRPHCDAMLTLMSAPEVIKLTRAGRLDMGKRDKGPMKLLKKLRGKRGQDGKGSSSGAGQLAMLRRIPKILRFIPGTAQDLRAYFLSMQYWLSGSDDNLANLIRMLVDRYAAGARAGWRGRLQVAAPVDYPETGLYHPRLPDRVTEDVDALPLPMVTPPVEVGAATGPRPTVGLIVLRAYVLSRDAAHYDGVIAAMEAQGMRVIPAFAAGLDARDAIDKYFIKDGKVTVDALVSLTGFSLVGGPAYNDAAAAEEILARLDVPYLAAHALEFQSVEQWSASDRGLQPVENTIMVAIPELDGATNPIVFGGRSDGSGMPCSGCGNDCLLTDPARLGEARPREMHSCSERAERLAMRTLRLIRLRRRPVSARKVAIVLFNFPPNAGATGTAAFLGVWESLFNTLHRMAEDGYDLTPPASVEALREAVLGDDPEGQGTEARIAATIPTDAHVADQPHLSEIEAVWGPAPGRHNTDGASIQILGAHFGNVFVGLQPAFGWEGDPMRLLFEGGFAPTHAFAAFYRWIERGLDADAVLHFGTHGALEFMPGKQTGQDHRSWPDRLIRDLPNIYLYAANNPSEGALARRRGSATLVSHLTPPVCHAGLYRGLADLKASIDRWRMGGDEMPAETRARLAEQIQAEAANLDLAAPDPVWSADDAEARLPGLTLQLSELEHTLIPHGLHVLGRPAPLEERAELLAVMADAGHGLTLPHGASRLLAEGAPNDQVLAAGGLDADDETLAAIEALATAAGHLSTDTELPALMRALEGRYIRPVPGGDLIRQAAILPTGRNIHGHDPFRLPSAFAMGEGERQTQRLLARHIDDNGDLPRRVALVLWGTDTIKQEGGPMAQALALMGARPRRDSYGRVCGAELVPLEELGRPRIDVIVTLSGIFRDLLPIQTRVLAEAAALAAAADEDPADNWIRAAVLERMEATGCDLETAALRVFSNADGAYGSNVNALIDSGAWTDEDELADAYTARKCFAYGVNGKPVKRAEALGDLLGGVDLAYQTLDSVELGVTTIDHYFDTLGGIGRAVRRARDGEGVPVYIGDHTRGEGTVRSLSEQVALETRTRTLNPKWFEGMLSHGAEGVRQIEASITNTVGWSATTGQVEPWVYQRVTETFVLDAAMRRRLASLNPKASARLAGRLIEAQERQYWDPDPETLAALHDAAEELEDRLEGIEPEPAPEKTPETTTANKAAKATTREPVPQEA